MSDLLHFATRKGLFTYQRQSNGFKPLRSSFVGVPVSNLLTDHRDGTLYAALKHGHFGPKMHRSSDQGQTWEEITCPEYPPMPEGVEPPVNPHTGKVIPWKLVMIWELAIDYANDGGIFAGTLPGGLFHSNDRGDSWELNRPFWDLPERYKWFGGGYDEPGIHSVLTHPDQPNTIMIGISCGGMWVSEDNGESWTRKTNGMRAGYMPPELQYDGDAQDPHIIVQCRDWPDTLWTQHHSGIFKTTNAGEQWEEFEDVKPSNFGFACAVHPEDGNTAWFVPGHSDELRIPVDGRVVVTRTRNGGQSFEVLTEGLPQEHAYDLVYRHALALDEDPLTLAMGSTTGNAWVSHDEGDSWEQLSGHLPPVYAVKFG